MHAIYRFVESGKLAEAADLWKSLFPVNLFFWTHVYNASVKAATNLSGRIVGPCRNPVQTLTDSEMREMREDLKPLGI
ncbi:MAG: dihydrodipicolinate synthase family protein [Desulfobacterales bacterium]|nr:MAG: dihydrodipicolinate synthase family protein [Desulfobacterales bacterium]